MASSPSPPKPVDPNAIISAQERANRVNRITPFGSQTYGPDGSLTTTLPQGTQDAFNNITEMAGNKQHLLNAPQGMGDLQSALMARVQNNTSPQQKGSNMQMPSMGANGKPGADAWGQALSQVWKH